MAYSKNYYHVLGLSGPDTSPATNAQPKSTALRRAYRNALLAAHPDKHSPTTATATAAAAGVHTVDDVKEAFRVLDDTVSRAEYDAWALRSPHFFSSLDEDDTTRSTGGMQTLSPDFVLGLDVLDLSDFEEVPADAEGSRHGDENGNGSDKKEGGSKWIRPCRCGDSRGFCVDEGELESALARGEGEVLVGCRGCSLWVRVGFGVEED